MKYTLVGSQTSPYVRKLRMFMYQEKISFNFKEINMFEEEGANYLASISPINKIPVLLFEQGEVLWDSRVIFNYFQKMKNKNALTLEEENILSAIDAGIDANIIRLIGKRSGLDINGDFLLFNRNNDRTESILKYLSPFISGWTNQRVCNFLSISMFCFLDWLVFRDLYDLSSNKECLKFLEYFSELEVVKKYPLPRT